MALQPISELWTVQERITELQRRQTHRNSCSLHAANNDPTAARRAIRSRPETTDSQETRRKSLGSFLRLLFSCFFSSQSFRTRSCQRPWETGLSQDSLRHSADGLYDTRSEHCQTSVREKKKTVSERRLKSKRKQFSVALDSWKQTKNRDVLITPASYGSAKGLLLWERETPAGVCWISFYWNQGRLLIYNHVITTMKTINKNVHLF